MSKKTKPKKSQEKKELRERKLIRKIAEGERARKRKHPQKKGVS